MNSVLQLYKNMKDFTLPIFLKQLRDTHEFVFIDCPAGLEKGLRNVLNAGRDLQPILVVSPDDLSLRDGERALALLEQKRLPQSRLIVNRLQADLISAGEQYSAATVAALLGVLYSGNFYVPLDAAMPEARLGAILEGLRPAAILSPEGRGGAYGKALSFAEAAAAAPANGIPGGVLDVDPAYMIFTSGSTGRPKGIPVSH